VTDLAPLTGMKLTRLYCDGTRTPDLAALKGMPLVVLHCRGYDLKSPGTRGIVQSLKDLTMINSVPAAEFWKNLDKE
jgi:hypothetical protein